jgi:hypothetical protein
MKRRWLGFYMGAAAALAGGVAHAQSSPWFRADFNNLNQSGTNMYNFANRYAQSTTTWQTSHLATGGWNGSGAPRVQVFGCSGGAGCNTAEHQFNIGWVTPAVGGSRQMGDSVFIRYRMKIEPNSRFVMDQFGAKFILFGQSSGSPNSRWIIHLLPPKENQGCTLGFESYPYFPWTPPSFTWVRAAQWGLPGDFGSATGDRYAGFQSSVNIGWSCVPSVLLAPSDHARPVPKPQSRGEAPTDGWYHLQFQATSGAAGQAAFRIWANNNAQSSPSTERTNLPDGLGVTGWNGGVEVGGYWGTGQTGTIGFVIDDFEIGPTFDPNWFPGTTIRPNPPTGVN